MNPYLKNGFKWLGFLLSIAGLIFVTFELRNYWNEISQSQWEIYEIACLSILVLIYSFSNYFLVLGWINILLSLGVSTSLLVATRIYGISQIAKYAPGNVFHVVGRQALGAAENIPQMKILKSTVLEIILITSVAVSFIPFFVYKLDSSISRETGFLLYIAILGFCTVAAAILMSRPLICATLFYGCQVVTSSLIFLAVFLLAGGGVSSSLDALVVIGGFALSWLAGLLTPGAPAGLGVREASLVFLLNGSASSSVVLTAALLGRVVTTMGDLLFYGYAKLTR